ncbi:hypothetical protein [Thalassovita mangrovi]|uniref:Lipoprotein n=1 Tax=Thalassovita mangrovi TaxID=2692236 RepID=A0A6L8LN83_9RHOB|nr:hypothetical protein [Thalassovita mangrovi]MYM57491.1 hypothetical protein [Thalassovita mangrovi]
MPQKFFGLMLALLMAAACSSSNYGNEKRSARLGEYDVAWNDIFASKMLREIHPQIVAGLADNESVYLFTAYKPDALNAPDNRPSVTLSDGSTVYGDIKSCDIILFVSSREMATRKYKKNKEEIEANKRKRYEECRAKMAKLPPAPPPAPRPAPPSLDKLIHLSQMAVKAQGSCQWLGYDRSLDMAVRAGGSLASFSDTRLFFAKLRCG